MLEKKWINELPYIMLAVLIAFFLSTHSPNLEYDTPSYINFGPERPPLYPAFIWLFHWANSYQFYLVVWAQGILLFGSLLYARYWLRKNLQINDFPIFLICLIVTFTISFHYQLMFVQSEGLSFPFFIWTFFLLIECFYKFSLKKLSYLAILVSLLVLTRLQFYYLYVIFILLGFWYLWQRIPFKSLIMGMLILFGSMFLTTLIDHGYHYYKHGYFANAPYGGFLVLVQTLYLADNDAAKYFQNPNEKIYIQKMIDKRNIQHLNKDAHLTTIALRPSYYEYAYQSYSRNYLALLRIIENTLKKTNIENSVGNNIKYDANSIAININKTLIFHELKKNLLFFLWKFVHCLGGVPLFLFFLILSLSLSMKIIYDKIREPGLSSIFITMISIITLLNAAIIAACNPDLPAYFCYSQFMLYCLAAFLANRTFLQNTSYLRE